MTEQGDLRIVIASTGRSGTTWLQLLLSYLYEAVPTGARDVDPATGLFEPDGRGGLLGVVLKRTRAAGYGDWPGFWRSLPPRAIIHSHWHAHPPIIEELRRQDASVVTMTRHPFDVMISHLAWVNRNPELDLGMDFLKGATPTSPAFLAFATGELSRWLLSISRGWWLSDGVHGVRYEDLRADTARQLQDLVDWLGVEPVLSIDEAIKRAELGELKQQSTSFFARLAPQGQRAALLNLRRTFLQRGARDVFVDEHRERNHFWHGRPGLWRSLLPAQQAAQIGDAQRELLEFFSYPCDPDNGLTTEEAEANWRRLL